MRIVAMAGLAAVLVLTQTSCGARSDNPGDRPARAISVREAMAEPEDRTLRVVGALLWDGREMLICDAVAESSPPQCMQGMRLRGWDPAQIPPGTPTAGGVQVVDRAEVTVHRSGKVLVVTRTAS